MFLAQGIVLTFYAFIGFEDTLNVAEELKNPRRNLPLGLVMALVLTVVIYMSVAISAVSVVPWQELAAANAPLAEVVARAAPWFPAWVFIVITVFAVANTGLINYITTSRLFFGMARDGHLPPILARVHPVRRTPHVAIALIFALIAILILAGDISELASATVLLLLLVFLVVNSALVVLKLRPDEPEGGFELPIAVPALGAVVCVVMFGARVGAGDWRAPAIAGVLLLGVAACICAAAPTGRRQGIASVGLCVQLESVTGWRTRRRVLPSARGTVLIRRAIDQPAQSAAGWREIIRLVRARAAPPSGTPASQVEHPLERNGGARHDAQPTDTRELQGLAASRRRTGQDHGLFRQQQRRQEQRAAVSPATQTDQERHRPGTRP